MYLFNIFQTGDFDGNWSPHPFDWIYQAPAVVVLIVNVIFLIIIMWVSHFLITILVIAKVYFSIFFDNAGQLLN